jgi:hypothetical protein
VPSTLLFLLSPSGEGGTLRVFRFASRGSLNNNAFLRCCWVLSDNSDTPIPQNNQVERPQDAKERANKSQVSSEVLFIQLCNFPTLTSITDVSGAILRYNFSVDESEKCPRRTLNEKSITDAPCEIKLER